MDRSISADAASRLLEFVQAEEFRIRAEIDAIGEDSLYDENDLAIYEDIGRAISKNADSLNLQILGDGKHLWYFVSAVKRGLSRLSGAEDAGLVAELRSLSMVKDLKAPF